MSSSACRAQSNASRCAGLLPFNCRVSETFQQRRSTATNAASPALLPKPDGRGMEVGPPFAPGSFVGEITSVGSGAAVGGGGSVGSGVGVISVICKRGAVVGGTAEGSALGGVGGAA